ncbi:MAG: hypothetical protein JJU42_07165 [Rhodobacteraceae bacterium]|nr:hypothetical protein [Paracoccaceae bacterium]
MRIGLHLGAHKTASTYLQRALKRQRDGLLRAGVAAFGPDRLRSDLRLPSLAEPDGARAADFAPLREAIAAEHAAGRRVLLSEENLLGTTRPGRIAHGAQLYPLAAPRVSAVLSGLGVTGARVFLAIRSPLPFLISGHGQQAKAGRLMAFGRYIDAVDPLALRWSDLVARLVSVRGVARVTVWRFEDHAAVLPAVLERMLGARAAPRLRLPARTSNSGPSARALDAALAALADDPARAPHDALRAAMAQWPKSRDHPGPAPFDSATLAQGAAAYDADMATLARLDGVDLLRPEAGPAKVPAKGFARG